jgi:presenilin-like A22 family membrane protease
MKLFFNLKSFLVSLLPFAVTQILGVYVAWRFLPETLKINPITIKDVDIWSLIYLVVFMAVFTFIVIKFKKVGTVFYKVLLIFLVFSGVQAILSIWLNSISSMVFSAIFNLVFWLARNVIMQNIAMVLTLAGIGAVLGLSIDPLLAVAILVILSFYDIIAVYKTRHMITMAQDMMQSGALFGFIIPQKASGFKEKTTQIVPGDQFMVLGSGDVVLPLLLTASLVRQSMGQALIVLVFSLLGLLFMNLVFTNQKIRRPMAALPPIAALTIIGYLVALLMK